MFSIKSLYLQFHQLISYRSCMEHSLHLAAGHVLSHITPVYTNITHKAINDEENDKTSADSATSDECSAIIATRLRKLLGLIKQVCIIYRICSIY
jgi:hypothetical protein